MNTSETLNLAADLIEERGWTAGDGWVSRDDDSPAPLCLEGGIQAAQGMRGWGQTAMDQLHACPAYVAVTEYLNMHRAYHWNDAPHRTAYEVIEVLRACAVIEAARENADIKATAHV